MPTYSARIEGVRKGTELLYQKKKIKIGATQLKFSILYYLLSHWVRYFLSYELSSSSWLFQFEHYLCSSKRKLTIIYKVKCYCKHLQHEMIIIMIIYVVQCILTASSNIGLLLRLGAMRSSFSDGPPRSRRWQAGGHGRRISSAPTLFRPALVRRGADTTRRRFRRGMVTAVRVVALAPAYCEGGGMRPRLCAAQRYQGTTD